MKGGSKMTIRGDRRETEVNRVEADETAED